MTTTTITNTGTTPVPVKTDAMTWECFANDLVVASETEEARLLRAVPTPELTAERGTQAWDDDWAAQYHAGIKRRALLMKFNARLVLEVGKALAAAVPTFRSLDVEYQGSGDSGEACDISVFLHRPQRFDADGKPRWATHDENQEDNREADAAAALLPSELKEWLDETCWAIAYDRHPGFEIDAGGFGQIVVARADDDDLTSPLQLTINHTERVEQSYDEEVLV